MATYYLDSAAGSNTSPFDTWAKAATAWANLTLSNNDIVYMASTHADSIAATTNLLTTQTGVQVICADKTSGAPPTTSATGGVIEVTGASHTLTLSSGSSTVSQWYGVTFRTGSGQSTNCGITIGSATICNNCQFESLSSGASTFAFNQQNIITNCRYKAGHANSYWTGSSNFGTRFDGITLLSGGTNPNYFCSVASGDIEVSNLDLSNAGTGINVVSVTAAAKTLFRKLKMPAAWAGAFVGASAPAGYHDFINVSAGTTALNARRTRDGSVDDEATFVISGGSAVSKKFTALSTANFFRPATTAEMEVANTTTGSAVTVTIEILCDNATSNKNTDIWAVIRYSDSTTTPHGATVSSAPAGPLEAGTTITSSVAAWNTTGMANPQKQKIVLSVTPQQAGPLYVRLYSTRAIAIYYDPNPALS